MGTPITVEYTDTDFRTKRESFYTYGEAVDFMTTYGAMSAAEVVETPSSRLYMEV